MSDAHDEELLAELGQWIERHPEVWPPSDEFTISDARIDEIITGVLAGQQPVPANLAAMRRRRRRIVGAACFALAATSGAVVAAAVLRSEQPTQPQAGVVCRAEADARADAIVLAPGIDPIEGCAALWSSGQFQGLDSDKDITGNAVPPLGACIGGGGVVEVFPGDLSVCADLALAAADPTLSPENQAIVDLQDRLVTNINMPECIPVAEATKMAAEILDDAPLSGWKVTVSPEAKDGTCGKVAVDATSKQLIVNHLDLQD